MKKKIEPCNNIFCKDHFTNNLSWKREDYGNCIDPFYSLYGRCKVLDKWKRHTDIEMGGFLIEFNQDIDKKCICSCDDSHREVFYTVHGLLNICKYCGKVVIEGEEND